MIGAKGRQHTIFPTTDNPPNQNFLVSNTPPPSPSRPFYKCIFSFFFFSFLSLGAVFQGRERRERKKKERGKRKKGFRGLKGASTGKNSTLSLSLLSLFLVKGPSLVCPCFFSFRSGQGHSRSQGSLPFLRVALFYSHVTESPLITTQAQTHTQRGTTS